MSGVSSKHHTPSFASILWRSYMRSLERRPLLAKAATSALLSASGDVLAQILEQKLQRKELTVPGQTLPQRDQGISLNWLRIAKFALFGFILAGPVCHGWYRLLDRSVPRTVRGSSLVKLLLDQLLFAPAFTALFFVVMGAADGQRFRAIKRTLVRDLGPTMVMNWRVWPFAMWVNFRFLPPDLQVLFANFVALFWNTYLSLMRSK